MRLAQEDESEHGSTWRRCTTSASAPASGSATAARAAIRVATAATAGLAVDSAVARGSAAGRWPAERDAVLDNQPD